MFSSTTIVQYLHSHILVKCLMFTTCCIWWLWPPKTLVSRFYNGSDSMAFYSKCFSCCFSASCPCCARCWCAFCTFCPCCAMSIMCSVHVVVHVVQVVVVHVANVVPAQALDVARAKGWHQRRRLIPSRLPLEATLRNCSAQRIDQSIFFSFTSYGGLY